MPKRRADDILEEKNMPTPALTEETAPLKSVKSKKSITKKQENSNIAKLKDNRKRNWAIVVYPESAPENWRDILDDEHMEWIESPLHDKDINPDGSIKKPHWHVMLLFDGNKSYEQIKEITDKINAPSPKYIQSVRAMVRYFAHLDNPEKAQYSISEIKAHGGVDLIELLKPTASSRYQMIAEMVEYIQVHSVTEFIDFMIFCSECHFDDWFPLLCDSAAFVIQEVIKSNRHKPTKLAVDALGVKNEL